MFGMVTFPATPCSLSLSCSHRYFIRFCPLLFAYSLSRNTTIEERQHTHITLDRTRLGNCTIKLNNIRSSGIGNNPALDHATHLSYSRSVNQAATSPTLQYDTQISRIREAVDGPKCKSSCIQDMNDFFEDTNECRSLPRSEHLTATLPTQPRHPSQRPTPQQIVASLRSNTSLTASTDLRTSASKTNASYPHHAKQMICPSWPWAQS